MGWSWQSPLPESTAKARKTRKEKATDDRDKTRAIDVRDGGPSEVEV